MLGNLENELASRPDSFLIKILFKNWLLGTIWLQGPFLGGSKYQDFLGIIYQYQDFFELHFGSKLGYVGPNWGYVGAVVRTRRRSIIYIYIYIYTLHLFALLDLCLPSLRKGHAIAPLSSLHLFALLDLCFKLWKTKKLYTNSLYCTQKTNLHNFTQTPSTG